MQPTNIPPSPASNTSFGNDDDDEQQALPVQQLPLSIMNNYFSIGAVSELICKFSLHYS